MNFYDLNKIVEQSKLVEQTPAPAAPAAPAVAPATTAAPAVAPATAPAATAPAATAGVRPAVAGQPAPAPAPVDSKKFGDLVTQTLRADLLKNRQVQAGLTKLLPTYGINDPKQQQAVITGLLNQIVFQAKPILDSLKIPAK